MKSKFKPSDAVWENGCVEGTECNSSRLSARGFERTSSTVQSFPTRAEFIFPLGSDSGSLSGTGDTKAGVDVVGIKASAAHRATVKTISCGLPSFPSIGLENLMEGWDGFDPGQLFPLCFFNHSQVNTGH